MHNTETLKFFQVNKYFGIQRPRITVLSTSIYEQKPQFRLQVSENKVAIYLFI